MSDKELDETITMLTKEKDKRSPYNRVRRICISSNKIEFLTFDGRLRDTFPYLYKDSPTITNVSCSVLESMNLHEMFKLDDIVWVKSYPSASVKVFEHIICALFTRGYSITGFDEDYTYFAKGKEQ